MIRLQCPGCEKTLGIPDSFAGRVAACPRCKQKFKVPAAEAPAEEEAEEERVTAKPRPAPRPQARRPADGVQKRPARPAPPPVEEESEEDELEEVSPPPRRRAVEDDEDEEPVRRPRRRKRRRRRRERASSGMDPMLMGALGVGGVVLLIGLGGFLYHPLALLPLLVGFLVSSVGGIWFLIVAFQDSPLHGILCFLFGPYSLFYLITHWDEEWKPFVIQMIGFALIMLGLCAGGGSGLLVPSSMMHDETLSPNRPPYQMMLRTDEAPARA